jgi:hypothetical protein
MDGLKTVFPKSENEAIDIFCSEYQDQIKTPDGFTIICKNPRKIVIHICGGKQGEFQQVRARYTLWPQYILLHPEDRTILIDNSSKNFVFFLYKHPIPYAVICSPLKNGKLNLISGFIVTGKRVVDYRKGNSPYSFYKKQKSC